MLGFVNDWRAANGVSPLVLDAVLIAAATTKSDAMARTGVLGHEIEGVDARENLLNHGYPADETWWGENLAWGQSTAQTAFTWWKNSSHHNANMLNANFRALGVGLVRRTGTPYTYYWTQTFGGRVVDRVPDC
jgi:uncharacterized protein YkwD